MEFKVAKAKAATLGGREGGVAWMRSGIGLGAEDDARACGRHD
jgi:hypothetical protein